MPSTSRGIAVKVLEGIAAGEHAERSLVLNLALALAEDHRRDIVRKTNNGLDAAHRRGRVGGRRPVVDDVKRAAILASRRRGESIRTIAAGVTVSVGVVHKPWPHPSQRPSGSGSPPLRPDRHPAGFR
jgi:DNA invertase Pin-like site-specific DNA recombinase